MYNSESVSVEDFIENTLAQIRRGVSKERLGSQFITVSFELGVEIVHTKTTKTDGGVKLCVASVLKAGSSGQSAKDNEHKEYNRISFDVNLNTGEELPQTARYARDFEI